MAEKVFVMGAGGWGTALALVLNERGVDVTLWGHDSEYAEEMARSRRNPRYLPGVEIPSGIRITPDVEGIGECRTVFSVVPSQHLRAVLQGFKGKSDAPPLYVSATKGIEFDTLMRPSEIIQDVLGDVPVVVVNGPSHAEEVARRMPTTVVSACRDNGRALFIQDLLHTQRFRVYTNRDPTGVELAGALKNVVSIAGGIVDGLGFGDNTKAALLTRGLVEMVRLGTAFDAERETFFGLAGIGDLITSCASLHGRNRAVGERIGRGEKIADIVQSMRQVAEGVRTSEAVYRLAGEKGVEMPICQEVYRVLYQDKDASTAVGDLMSRQLKGEQDW